MPHRGSHQVLVVGDCLLDRPRGLLVRAGVPVPLRPKAYALLAHLADNAGRVVGKSELLSAIWPDVFVTEDSLTQAMRELRKAIGDEGQQTIRTIAKRGYLLFSCTAAPEPPRDQPVVAVLRFANRGAAGEEPFVDGFAEDLVNGLARFRTVTVLARNSTFAFASDDACDWRETGGRLGADFLVLGSVRLAAEAIEARVSLVAAGKGAVLWSDGFSAAKGDVFDIQDEIAQRIVNRLATRLEDASLASAASRPTTSLAAYELVVRGLIRLRGYGRDDNLAAKSLFEQALAKDPDYALAHSYVALAELAIGGYGEAQPQVVAGAVDRAATAVTLAPEEPRCHRVLALTRLHAREHEAAEYHLRRSLDLNPCDADTMAQMGYLLTMRGKPFEAIAWLDRAVRINPIHPDWYHNDRSMALYGAGDYAGALASLSKLPVKTPWRMTRLAACHAQLGDLETARRLIAEIKQTAPDYSPMDFARQGMVFEHAADVEHLAEGVAKALAG